MADSTIPVDPFNPGQVFACLGLAELAETLLGKAEAGFDWSGPAVLFRLRARGEACPVAEALRFLAEAEVVTVAPADLQGPWPTLSERSETFPASPSKLRKSGGSAEYTEAALPVRLHRNGDVFEISHRIDGSGRETFKLFAGQQRGFENVHGLVSHQKRNDSRKGCRELWREDENGLIQDPFGVTERGSWVVVPINKGRFGFDARGAWDTMRIGWSADNQKIPVGSSPFVEMLAAIGLQNARPVLGRDGDVRYHIWEPLLPMSFARPALAHADALLGGPEKLFQVFRTHMGDDKYYKKFFYAEKE